MKTAKETAYDILKSRILSGEYDSGFQLKELDIAEQLGVSRTPARQAIKRLATEGLVVIKSNRRSYVADLTVEQFHQVFDVLAFLEGYSAALAARNIDSEQLAELKELNEQMNRCNMSEAAGRTTFSVANTQFHRVIHEASGNERICEMIMPLVELAGFMFRKHGEIERQTGEEAVHQHDKIIDALESGNSELARLQMQLHRESVRAGFTALWKDLEYDA